MSSGAASKGVGWGVLTYSSLQMLVWVCICLRHMVAAGLRHTSFPTICFRPACTCLSFAGTTLPDGRMRSVFQLPRQRHQATEQLQRSSPTAASRLVRCMADAPHQELHSTQAPARTTRKPALVQVTAAATCFKAWRGAWLSMMRWVGPGACP